MLKLICSFFSEILLFITTCIIIICFNFFAFSVMAFSDCTDVKYCTGVCLIILCYIAVLFFAQKILAKSEDSAPKFLLKAFHKYQFLLILPILCGLNFLYFYKIVFYICTPIVLFFIIKSFQDKTYINKIFFQKKRVITYSIIFLIFDSPVIIINIITLFYGIKEFIFGDWLVIYQVASFSYKYLIFLFALLTQNFWEKDKNICK